MSNDQAQKLRELVENEKKCKTVFFMSGSEKVGQTVAITNIATFISENNYKTLILDSGSGFFRTDVMLNVFPKYGVKSIINNDESLEEILVSINDNLEVIYMRPIFEEIQTSKEMLAKLQKYLKAIKQNYDFILIDLEETRVSSIKSLIDKDTKLIFTLNTNNLECLKRTYSIVKEIEVNTDMRKVNIIINKVKEKSIADEYYNRLKMASDKFLGVQIENMGYISNDDKIPQSLKEQIPIVKSHKDSEVYNEFKDIFTKIILD